MSDEPIDIRKAVTDAIWQLLDNYKIDSTQWVLPPRVYDEAERQIKAGTAKPETIVVMRNAVRAEEM